MRNLKKFLALVMAMVMAFSLMLTVNAAHIGTQYTDEDDVTPAFEEAMEVLTGMGVYQGDPGATFRPASTITRAETAALIYRLATGDTTDARKDLYKDYGNFADVSSTDWFAGYVGYCANAGYIKGHGGYFNPYGQVTGYEVLAMVLRAVGYDKNHEFEGATWQTNVSALSTQLGILKQVKSTDYGDRLYEASRRDVVASLIFETAQIPMVNYTAIAGYNKFQNLLDNELNPSLGYKNFGLKDVTRIIVGNQATGESCTYLGPDMKPMEYKGDTSKLTKTLDVSYDYPGTLIQSSNAVFGGDDPAGDLVVPDGIKLDWKSDLGLFGHKVKVWYDATDSGNKTTYALFDKAELSAVVKAVDNTDLADTGKTGGVPHLGKAAENAGFEVPTATDMHYSSASFSRMGYNSGTEYSHILTAGNVDEAAVAPDSTVFVLVANDSDKEVDVVVPVKMQIGQINHINNQVDKDKTFSIGSDAISMQDDPAVLQSYVMNPEQIVLGNTVVVTEVTERTNKPDATKPIVYWLDTPTKKVTGTVVAYDYDGAAGTGTQKVTLDDGTELKRTIVDDGVLVSGLTNVKDKAAATDPCYLLAHAKYEFLLDMQGNWINAKRIYDQNFLYGTYLDYVTSLGTSTFTHRIVGVDFNGEVKTYDIDRYKMEGGAAAAIKLDGTSPAGQPAAVGIPYRGSYANASTQTMIGRDAASVVDYRGFIVSGTTINNTDAELKNAANIESFDTESFYTTATDDWKIDTTFATATHTIDKDDLKMGVFLLPKAAAQNTALPLYLTESTKFIVINKDGYGTDTLKPTVYNGLTEFLGNSSAIELRLSAAAAASEILYTSSPYVYANTGASAKQVDTIFIPATEFTRVGNNGLYYFPKTTNVVDTDGSGAKLFTAYLGGEKTSIWVRTDTVDDAATIEGLIQANTKYGSFQYMEPTSDKAADGQPIYKIAPAMNNTYDNLNFAATVVCCTNPGGYDGTNSPAVTFNGTTNNGLTALVNTNVMVGTANAKVVNLVDGYTIENINDLNDVASVGSDGGLTSVKVVLEFVEAGSNQVATIYVVDIT